MENSYKLGISIDQNPFTSKQFIGMLSHKPAGWLVYECQKEILAGTRLNDLDIPFYIAAMESLIESLMTTLDEKGIELLNHIRAHGQTITTHADKINPEDLKDLSNLGGDSDEA